MCDLRRFGVRGPDDGDDIEARGLVEFVVELEPCECGAGESQLPAAVDGFEWLTVSGGGAGFDFGEDVYMTVESDDVDFAEVIAELGIDDAVAELFEEGDGGIFAAGSEHMGRGSGHGCGALVCGFRRAHP